MMFQIAEFKNNLRLSYGSDAIIHGVEFVARLHNGEEVQLRCQSVVKESPRSFARLQADEVYRVTYTDELNRVTAYLDLAVKENAVAVYVEATVRNKELFRDRLSFAAVNGIELRVREFPELNGVMANYQHKDWWTRPYFDMDLRKLPNKTLSLLWRRTNRLYAHLLPVCDRLFRTDLGGSEDGVSIRISAFQGGFSRCDTLAFVLGCGTDPFGLAGENVRIALEACDAVAKPRTEKSYPDILDYLGWCSWDAFYQQVNAEGLLQKTDELASAGIPVRWIMIDDGWSEVSDDKRLRSYDAVKSKFPDGLAGVIHEMKQRCGIRWVGVWHTIAGYWGGIDPKGELFEPNKSHLYHTNGCVWIPYPDAAVGFGFWHDWHAYLKRQGVDFVKVDSQSAIINFMNDQAPIGAAASAAHTALEASVGLHFNGCVINCMGMASENIWHRPSSSVSRNSDDFVPQEADGFKEHAFQNAYNSYYHGHFYWGDWDMYWTQNHDDRQNMVLRAVSGGPVYFSDKLGRTNADHIWPLIYRNGKIIRCDQPGQPTEDCLTVDPIHTPVPLKLWNRAGDSGVIAAFNVHGGNMDVEGTFSPADIPGFSDNEYWVYEHFNRRLSLMQANERTTFMLDNMDCAMYAVIPAHADVTPIGLINKLVSTDAIIGCRHESDKTVIRLKEGGLFAFAARQRPLSAKVNGELTELRIDLAQSGLYVVDCAHVLSETTVEIAC
jgi:raffinose synthase